MIVAIMQPYFFPYIGYFQLMAAVDAFVFLDDAQYVDHRWMNRNRIRSGDGSAWLTLPVRRDRLQCAINEREYRNERGDIDAARRKLHSAYRAAPHRASTMGLIEDLLEFPDPNVAAFNRNLLLAVARELDIDCSFEVASSHPRERAVSGQARVLALCSRLGATQYVNAIGGASLYDEEAFSGAGIALRFLRTRVPQVDLADGPEHLSIIDGLMHHGAAGCRARLPDYDLLSPAEARALS